MYFSAEDRGEMMSMVYNWPADQVCLHINDEVNIELLYLVELITLVDLCP